jgi:AcrR family transcriptional regulator
VAEPTSRPRPPRRSRTERSADSRQLILDATLECLHELGYARTTTLTIQARAGVSRGRLLHHFPSREGLLVAACQHLASTHLSELRAWPSGSPEHDLEPAADRLDLAVDVLWSTFDQPYFWGAVELWTAARTEPTLRATLRPEERRLGIAVRQAIDAQFGPAFTGHPRYPLVRETLLTSMRGVALTYSFDERDRDRDTHLPLWRYIARLLLEPADTPAPSAR